MISVILIPVHQCARCLIANCSNLLNQLLKELCELNFTDRTTRSFLSLHITLLGPTGPFFLNIFVFASFCSNILDIYKIVDKFIDVYNFSF